MKTDRGLKIASIVIAAIGLLDSLYLTYIKLAHKEALCAGIGDCDVVNTSPYSEIMGIPIALIGAGAYIAILAFLFLEDRPGFLGENAKMIVFGLVFIGVLYSAYLTYLEIAVIRAICPFCVLSAIALLILLFLTIIRMLRVSEEEE